MTNITGKGIFSLSKFSLAALAASGALLLTVSSVSSQTLDTPTLSRPPNPGDSFASAPTNSTSTGDGDSPASLEFSAPASTITTAPAMADIGGSSIANPSGSMLSGSTLHVPAGNPTLAFGAPPPAGASAATKAFTCGLLAGSLLVLGVVGVRMTRERSRMPD